MAEVSHDLDVIVAGGGLAGLVAAHLLSDAGLRVLVVEKKEYPFHRVCGEYISNEVRPFLTSKGLFPSDFVPAEIKKLLITAPSGERLEAPLAMGGFGISRYALDNFWYETGLNKGIEFALKTSVEDVNYSDKQFTVTLSDHRILSAKVVLGAFGKRSKVDMKLNRPFIKQRSNYIGVKYHVKIDFAEDVVSLHNFEDGYCGLNKVEDDRYNLCYLTSRENLRRSGDIPAMEEQIIHRNFFLRNVWKSADFLFDKPEVINEISFEKKSSVENHMLMIGDAAGLIAPLCGNGMAMAIHAAKIASELIIYEYKTGWNQERLERQYSAIWSDTFRQRLWFGRSIQSLFGKTWMTNMAVSAAGKIPALSQWMIGKTHGRSI